LLQANETGGSNQTELEGVKRCFGYLQKLGVTTGVFISDGHRGIAKWIRENCPGTTHNSPRTGGSVGWALGCYAGGREFDSDRTNTQGLKITEEKVLPL